jgi:hypothetical protein
MVMACGCAKAGAAARESHRIIRRNMAASKMKKRGAVNPGFLTLPLT